MGGSGEKGDPEAQATQWLARPACEGSEEVTAQVKAKVGLGDLEPDRVAAHHGENVTIGFEFRLKRQTNLTVLALKAVDVHLARTFPSLGKC